MNRPSKGKEREKEVDSYSSQQHCKEQELIIGEDFTTRSMSNIADMNPSELKMAFLGLEYSFLGMNRHCNHMVGL